MRRLISKIQPKSANYGNQTVYSTAKDLMGNHDKAEPLVSVILCTYNGADYVGEALECVLSQTFEAFEFRIVDDGSTDGTLEIIEDIAKRDARIILQKNSQNMGTGYSYSKALNGCIGQYIAQIGQDDRWDPKFLESVSNYLNQNTNCSAVFTNVRMINSRGEDAGDTLPFRFEWFKNSDQERLVTLLFKQNFVCTSGSLFRKSAVNGWHTLGDNDQLQDWNTWLKVIFAGDFRLIDEKLVDYRVHAQNLSLNGASRGLVNTELLHTRMQFLNSPEFWSYVATRSDRNRFLTDIVKSYFEFMEESRADQWQALFYSFRSHEHEYRDLKVMKELMGIMFWRFGAFAKAKRYLKTDDMTSALKLLPLPIQRKFTSQIYFGIAPKVVIQNSAWCAQFKIGPIVFIRAWNFHACRSILPKLFIDLNAPSMDRLLERLYLRRNLLLRIGGRIAGLFGLEDGY